MLCPCAPVGFLGGVLAKTLFGVVPPNTGKGEIVATLLTGTLTSMTSFVLKVFYQVPLCGQSQSMTGRIVLAFLKAQILGVIYYVPVSILIKKTRLNTCKNEDSGLQNKAQLVDFRTRKYSRIVMGIFLISEVVLARFIAYKNVLRISPSLFDRVVLVLGIIEAHYVIYVVVTKIFEKSFAKPCNKACSRSTLIAKNHAGLEETVESI